MGGVGDGWLYPWGSVRSGWGWTCVGPAGGVAASA